MTIVRGFLAVALAVVLSGASVWAQTEAPAEKPGQESQRTFYLNNVNQPGEVNEVTTALRNLLDPRVKIFPVLNQNAILIRATPDQMQLAQKLAGVVWIDEKARDVARLEAYFVKDVKFAGGLLANLQKGTSFVFEQAFINNEVWLPTYAEAHIGVRVLLVKGFKISAMTRYSDYKKFNVESLATISAPAKQ